MIGGGAAHGRVLAKGLADRGVRTLVVTLRTRPNLPLHERFEGCDIYRVGRSRSRWKGMASAYRILGALADHYDLCLGLSHLGSARDVDWAFTPEAGGAGITEQRRAFWILL